MKCQSSVGVPVETLIRCHNPRKERCHACQKSRYDLDERKACQVGRCEDTYPVPCGSLWFEGIRCYNTRKGSAIFRLDAHIRRLYDSAKIYRSDIPYKKSELEKA